MSGGHSVAVSPGQAQPTAERTDEIVSSSLPSRFGLPFPCDALQNCGTCGRTSPEKSSKEADGEAGSEDINASVDFEEFMLKEDLASEVSDRIRALRSLDTEVNQKRLVKKRTRDEVVYLHAGLGHMVDIFCEFVDPGLPKKQGCF